jgi:malate dehydrogenase (oxaloacetate-decarboxylating)
MSDPNGPLFPTLEAVREVSYQVALAVGTEAVRAGLTSRSLDSLKSLVADKMWIPRYVPLKHSVR